MPGTRMASRFQGARPMTARTAAQRRSRSFRLNSGLTTGKLPAAVAEAPGADALGLAATDPLAAAGLADAGAEAAPEELAKAAPDGVVGCVEGLAAG